jgi:hypothetical protein
VRQRLLAGALALAATVLVAGMYVYAYGTPSAPSAAGAQAPPLSAIAAESAPGGRVAESPATTRAPAPDPQSPLAVRIPGCVCHSDDPALVEEHAAYRMNQCWGCHAGGTTTMMGDR